MANSKPTYEHLWSDEAEDFVIAECDDCGVEAAVPEPEFEAGELVEPHVECPACGEPETLRRTAGLESRAPGLSAWPGPILGLDYWHGMDKTA